MDAALGILIATLEKAQGTMQAQLDRLSRARVPDKVRLPRLRAEARQFQAAGTSLLARLRRTECNVELDSRIQGIVASFEEAEARAATLFKNGPSNDPELGHDDDVDSDTFSDADAQEQARGSGQAVRVRSGAGNKSQLSSKGRRMRAASSAADLDLSRKSTANVIDLRSRRPLG